LGRLDRDDEICGPRPHSVDQERFGGPRGERELIHAEGPSLIGIDKL
jgi:hypothetical protein